MASGAIVTGSDSGIGRATALALARDGFDIGITWHTDESGAEETAALVRANGRVAHVRALDLAQPDDVYDIIGELADALDGLAAVVNNAAINHRAGVLEETLQDWARVLAINLTGTFACAQASAREMVRRGEGGRIVNVTSVHEVAPLKRGAAYAASKAGLGLLTKVMALELAEHGITVNTVAPGHIATPMTGWPGSSSYSPGFDEIPVGRIGYPVEVAATIAHLCSRDAAYTTGSTYLVDGGLVLMAVTPLQARLEVRKS